MIKVSTRRGWESEELRLLVRSFTAIAGTGGGLHPRAILEVLEEDDTPILLENLEKVAFSLLQDAYQRALEWEAEWASSPCHPAALEFRWAGPWVWSWVWRSVPMDVDAPPTTVTLEYRQGMLTLSVAGEPDRVERRAAAAELPEWRGQPHTPGAYGGDWGPGITGSLAEVVAHAARSEPRSVIVD